MYGVRIGCSDLPVENVVMRGRRLPLAWEFHHQRPLQHVVAQLAGCAKWRFVCEAK
jgi:hypothetical protein